MSQPEYAWRNLTPEQRAEVLAWRKTRGEPWHSPPHLPNFGHLRFHITAACFEHRHYIGRSPQRMDAFARDLLAVFGTHASQTFAWRLYRITITRWWKRPTFSVYCENSVGCTGARRT